MSAPPFSNMLKLQGIDLVRAETHTLQVNVGLLCNQTCRHCHLEADPGCREVMNSRAISWKKNGRKKWEKEKDDYEATRISDYAAFIGIIQRGDLLLL
jgi:hypothetical protein